MNNNEDDLQEQFEAGKKDKSLDSIAYQMVFDALKKDPVPALPPSFADNVLQIIQRTQSSRVSSLAVFLAIVGGLFSIGVFVAAIVLTGFKVQLGFLEGLGEFKGVFLFGAAFIILLNWVDKITMRKKASI
jgi:hypothetical protein